MKRRRRAFRRSGPAPKRQGLLPFRRRSDRLDRAFRVAIVGLTMLAMAGSVALTPDGRRLATTWPTRARWAVRGLVGLEPPRAEVEALVRVERLGKIEATRAALRDLERQPKMRDFLRAARMDADSAVVRWGNYDWTMALSSAVFAPDDLRSYRLLPETRSVWLINLTVNKVQAMFEIPDTPEARALAGPAGGRVVPESVQTTNSWGCRGPEPDPSAPIRGIILGDSNMQGLLVGDDQTPPARLQEILGRERGQATSILNTGHLGYSIEQYYQTLMEYHDRFRPTFVVVSICDNDFGDMAVASHWAESEYWLDRITQSCRTRGIPILIVPVPGEDRMVGRRNEAIFPGKVSAIAKVTGLAYLDPLEEFAAEHFRRKGEARRLGQPFPHSPLFNRRYGDNHMSPLGSDLWARIVARRLGVILDDRRPQ